MTVTTDKTRLSTYIDVDLKEKLEKLAKLQRRSVSNLIEVLVAQVVEQAERQGLLDSDDNSGSKF